MSPQSNMATQRPKATEPRRGVKEGGNALARLDPGVHQVVGAVTSELVLLRVDQHPDAGALALGERGVADKVGNRAGQHDRAGGEQHPLERRHPGLDAGNRRVLDCGLHGLENPKEDRVPPGAAKCVVGVQVGDAADP